MFLILLSVFLIPIKVEAVEQERVILIDPGHGGIDGGAKSQNGTIEKDINLQIALKLKDNLIEKGYTVKDSREGTIVEKQ